MKASAHAAQNKELCALANSSDRVDRTSDASAS
jgi:hypothetical protein